MERFERVLELLAETQEVCEAAKLNHPRLCIEAQLCCRSSRRLSGRNPERAEALETLRKIIDGGAWTHLLSESGMRSLMDSTARAKWDAAIIEGTFPALTLDNVRSTFESLHSTRADMFERGVLECFRRLSWDYKTNRPSGFGPRIIIRFLVTRTGGRHGYLHVNYRTADELDDLVRVFHVLDGKSEPDHRQGCYSQLMKAIDAGVPLENEYLTVSYFRNGNGHVHFKRLDLVDALNAILRKHHPDALPGARPRRRA